MVVQPAAARKRGGELSFPGEKLPRGRESFSRAARAPPAPREARFHRADRIFRLRESLPPSPEARPRRRQLVPDRGRLSAAAESSPRPGVELPPPERSSLFLQEASPATNHVAPVNEELSPRGRERFFGGARSPRFHPRALPPRRRLLPAGRKLASIGSKPARAGGDSPRMAGELGRFGDEPASREGSSSRTERSFPAWREAPAAPEDGLSAGAGGATISNPSSARAEHDSNAREPEAGLPHPLW